MTALANALRNQLETAVVAARKAAEAGARDALNRLAVGEDKAYDSMSVDDKDLRRRLRAKQRQRAYRWGPFAWQRAFWPMRVF